MEQRVTALYFSPTHGTRAYVRAVAAAIPGEHREVDLTRPRSGGRNITLQKMIW